ncbi:MAG: efflux RND transporter permease subunit, partial [Proteobacteria bacterium]|nr:efflux RND transporter permease subunit [Pseudomonadota bacterium]
VRVYVRFPEHRRATLDALKTMWIRLPDGRSVPFDVVGKVHERTGVSSINRFNRQRVVNVRAHVNKSLIEPGEVNKTLRNEILPRIIAQYPDVSFRFRGEAEAQADSSATLLLGAIFVLLMIYAALAIPLKSYGQPLLIMSAIPFGIVGAFLGHFILGKEISILSVIGMVGLTGIVVNDSLVLVDYINHRIDEGAQWRDAVMQAGVRRFRAVVLTSVTTFMGLLPIQLETSLQAQFVKPMAISVAFGVLFATVVTLFLVPVMFFVANDLKQLVVRKR